VSIFLYAFFISSSVALEMNHRPIVGILSVPYKNTEKSYVEQSYVRMVESSGARAVPIKWNANRREIDFLLNSVNGVLIAGEIEPELMYLKPFLKHSSAHFGTIHQTVRYILQKAFDFNKKDNIYFPVWLQGYGFEEALLNVARNTTILNKSHNKKHMTNLLPNDIDGHEIMSLIKSDENLKNLHLENVVKHRMFKSFDKTDLKTLFETKSVYIHTNNVVLAKDFRSNEKLTAELVASSFSIAKDGNVTVSSFEFKEYPVYATQFQADKIAYTIMNEDYIDHSIANIQANRKFADFFVEECKKNYQKFADKNDEGELIFENYDTVYRFHKYVYLFKRKDDD